MIETPRSDPTRVTAGGRQRLHVIRMFPDALRNLGGLGVRSPESHGGVGRGGDQGGVVLGQDDVVDPVAMGLDLRFKPGRAWLAIGSCEWVG